LPSGLSAPARAEKNDRDREVGFTSGSPTPLSGGAIRNPSSEMISSRSFARGTIRSTKPWLNQNSAR
jgi:hypothetical protein